MDNRQLVKILIVIAAVLIVVVEGLTLFGLVGDYFGGDDGAATPTDRGTPVDRVGVGDELFDETNRTETVTTATLASNNGRTLTLTVSVTNTGETPYELRLGNLTTRNDRRIENDATTEAIPPGETTTVTAQWSLPGSEFPDRVAVTALEYDGGSARVVVDREVYLAHMPVQG